MSVMRHAPPVTPSLVVTPAIVAHRGASGHRPEHTLESYRTAIRMGVDDIELDLVISRDGVLVARHENELSRSTDVANRSEFARRRRTQWVDGVEVTGWFTEDFTVAELKTLTARERMPATRPDNTAFDGSEGIATFNEVLAMVGAESARLGRTVGVMVELKHAAHFESLGRPVVAPLLADLRRHGVDHPLARVSLMSFETTVLKQLATLSRLPIIQLLEVADRRPPDLLAVGDPRTYGDLLSADGLAEIDEYADGIGPHKSLVLPLDAAGAIRSPSTVVAEAHARWLTVHVWTIRAENRFLPTNLRRGTSPEQHGDMAAEVRALLEAGVDGIITDHPREALSAARELLASH